MTSSPCSICRGTGIMFGSSATCAWCRGRGTCDCQTCKLSADKLDRSLVTRIIQLIGAIPHNAIPDSNLLKEAREVLHLLMPLERRG